MEILCFVIQISINLFIALCVNILSRGGAKPFMRPKCEINIFKQPPELKEMSICARHKFNNAIEAGDTPRITTIVRYYQIFETSIYNYWQDQPRVYKTSPTFHCLSNLRNFIRNNFIYNFCLFIMNPINYLKQQQIKK